MRVCEYCMHEFTPKVRRCYPTQRYCGDSCRLGALKEGNMEAMSKIGANRYQRLLPLARAGDKEAQRQLFEGYGCTGLMDLETKELKRFELKDGKFAGEGE